MKFTALIALVAARYQEEDLTEAVRTHYPAAAVKQFQEMEHELMTWGVEARAAFEKKHPNFRKEMNAFKRSVGERYGEEFMGWAHSPSVRAVEGAKAAMMVSSKEMHTLMSDFFTLYMEFTHGGVEMGWGFNADGSYDEWMSNKSARHVFEELYTIAQHMRQLIDSPQARNLRRLEKLTLADPHFQKMFAMVQEDLDLHSWNEVEERLMHVGMQMKAKMEKCPMFHRLMDILMRMKQLCDTSKEVTDLDAEGYVAWWNKKNFQNPFAGMRPDDFEMLI
jgi:hypothetical protein